MKYKMSEELKSNLDSWYQQYYAKRASNEIKFGNKWFVIFEKPCIQTSFCFAYDEVGDPQSVEASEELAKHVRKSESYFVNANLRELLRKKELCEGNELILIEHGYLDNVCSIYPEDVIERGYYSKDKVVYRLNEEDKKNLIKIIDEEIEKFTKRLNSYLKRYGTNCVRSWTYSMND